MVKERILKVQALLEENGAMLITGQPNRYYFTGMESSAGMVLITKKNAYFMIDFRYVEKAKKVVKDCQVRLSSYSDQEIGELCAQDGAKILHIEAYEMSVDRLEQLKAALPELILCTDPTIDDAIIEMRSMKTAGELELIQKAQKITDDTFAYILDRIKPGRTEREVMLDMEFFMRKQPECQGVSFDFIVVSGKNSSLPHGVPSDKKIEVGDFVTMDFGAIVGGYCSDMTRTVAVGAVTEEQKKVYNTVLQAQLAALDAVKAGLVCKDVDKIARDIIYNAGYEGCFGHGLGHSVGIEIHENPAFNMRCETILKPGTVMTVEPGIYLENKFGVRIEDMVYVTEEGSINLTASPKELIIL